jgi:hypothetical protein
LAVFRYVGQNSAVIVYADFRVVLLQSLFTG